MAHYKRGYPRRSVRCCMCTDHRDGNCGKHPVDLEDGWRDTQGRRIRKTRRSRPYTVEYKRTGKPPSWWRRGEEWARWCILGRYATETGALNAVRDAQMKDTGPFGSIRVYGSAPEYRIRYAVTEAGAGDGDCSEGNGARAARNA